MRKLILQLFLLLVSWPALASVIVQGQVQICKNSDATDCMVLDHDVDNLSDLGFDDNISYINIYPNTTVTLYQEPYFGETLVNYAQCIGDSETGAISDYFIHVNEEEILFCHKYEEITSYHHEAASPSGVTLDEDSLSGLLLNDSISSLRIHPLEVAECDLASIDDCLLEWSRPILIYDEEEDCRAMVTSGSGKPSVFARVDTFLDGDYKKVTYMPYHYDDCGAPDAAAILDAVAQGSVAGVEYFTDAFLWLNEIILDSLLWIFGLDDDLGDFLEDFFFEVVDGVVVDESMIEKLNGHPHDTELIQYVYKRFSSISASDDGTYWGLMAASHQHHNTSTEKSLEGINWPLRVYISESKHAQYFSKAECELYELNDNPELESLPDALSFPFEDCDAFALAADGSWQSEGSEGGFILYPNDYDLLPMDYSDIDGYSYAEKAIAVGDTGWFEGFGVASEDLGFVILEVTNIVYGEVISVGESMWYEDIDLILTDIQVESGGALHAEGESSVVANNVHVKAGSEAELSLAYESTGKIILQPEFYVDNGAELHVFVESEEPLPWK